MYRELLWCPYVAPSTLRTDDIDVLHITGISPISAPRHTAKVITLHDLALFRNPTRFRPWLRKRGQHFLRGLHKADKIISISQFTADEAIDVLGLASSQLEIVHEGCDFTPEMLNLMARPPEEEIPSEFFLFVGSLEPGKNLSLLRTSYEVAADRGIVLPTLVIVGARWEGVGKEGPPPDNWIYLGRQPDEVLVHLYGQALALVFPSLYEGFGLPLLEAMTLSCPVLCSPVASLPEVGGDAPLYCDQDAVSYLNGMQSIATSSSTRDEHIQAGLEQVKKFSWRTCAEETASVYREVCPT